MKTQKDRLKQYAKVVLIISCVFAVISSVLLVVTICCFPQAVEGKQQAEYLYENGIEVDAHIKSYHYNGGTPGNNTIRGHFHIEYEYVDDNGRSYIDEYKDTVRCETRAERSEREQYIKQMIADGTTKKMLIADNGLCRLSVNKESLKRNTALIVYSILIPVSSVVLALCIFGIVRQSETFRR